MTKYYLTKLSKDGEYQITVVPMYQLPIDHIVWKKESLKWILDNMEVGETRCLGKFY